MFNYSIISNSCVGYGIYEKLNPGVSKFAIEYTNPFVGHLFIDDFEYVKFCKNYDYYISKEPIFDEPKITTNWVRDVGVTRYILADKNYPVMHLDDVEIHWIHETNHNAILRKYYGRLELDSKIANKVFTWSISEMSNIHTFDIKKELIHEFLNTKYRSIFLTNIPETEFDDINHISYLVKGWIGLSVDIRNQNFLIPWNNQDTNSEIFKNIILGKNWVL